LSSAGAFSVFGHLVKETNRVWMKNHITPVECRYYIHNFPHYSPTKNAPFFKRWKLVTGEGEKMHSAAHNSFCFFGNAVAVE